MPININGTTGISGADGSAATPAIQGADTNTGIFFPAADTLAVATGGTERVRVDSSGNVGIGTSSPSGKLNVQDAVAAGRANITLLNNAAGNTSNRMRIRMAASSGFSGTDLYPYIEAYEENAANAAEGLAFGTYNGSSLSERMRIDSSGNLLVGTTLSGGGRQMLSFDNASQSGIRFLHGSTTYNGEVLVFLRADNTTKMGRVYCDGSTTVYTTTSDYRLKENVTPMGGALAKVQALKPVTYTWKDTGKHGEGFLAHELQEVCPGAVLGEKDAVNADGSIDAQTVDTSVLIATLTAAIQEQQAMIEELKAKVAALEAK